jgi:hypothetical protein
MPKHHINTLASCIKYLQVSGYKVEFKATAEGLFSGISKRIFQPEEVKIIHQYRFEGEKSPDDIAIVYALKTNTGEKGILVGKYETADVEHIADFIAKVKKYS